MGSGRGVGWWYWLATDVLLVNGLAGGPLGFAPVLLLGVAQTIHCRRREGHFDAFPVQVRVSFLALMLLGLVDGFRLILWLQLAGTTAVILVDYCFLARALSLMPWNRRRPLTLELVTRTFLSAPVKGSVLQGLAAK